ncbi:hypothetical protein Clacol_001662 [Clathrus columnatus]|uniref:Uncharacterized protein n=1 Tax=Clathrus columnatus TaxID=1419009 RepID=A0AAV5A385_9AGAM|nr:hypothetical protein Clacol_001662 [Clathrus columnatus]
MDRFYSPSSPEAQSFRRIETDLFWDSEHGSFTETLMGLCAAYMSLSRFIGGQDLYITPRNRSELFYTLRSYMYDALHNLIAHSRSALRTGGYTRACEIASKSIAAMLATAENTAYLLALHSPTRTTTRAKSTERQASEASQLNTVMFVTLYVADRISERASGSKLPNQAHTSFSHQITRV